MYGNVLGTSAIERMVTSGELVIDPFEEQHLGLAHYRVHVGAIYVSRPTDYRGSSSKVLREIGTHATNFTMGPDDYILVSLKEHVSLPEGMFGRILPASHLVEKGFWVNSGKIDAGYQTLSTGRSAAILLGIKNLLRQENLLDLTAGVAHVEFVDLRGTESRFGGFSDESLMSATHRWHRIVGSGGPGGEAGSGAVNDD